MALQTSGPISLTDVAGEFTGSTPHSLSEYYGVADGIPGSGTISLSNFYGKALPSPEPEPEPEPENPLRQVQYSGSITRTDFSSTPAFGGDGFSYVSSYRMGQSAGPTGGVVSSGLFCDGIGQLGGTPGLEDGNDFNRLYLLPHSSAAWNPFAYSTINVGVLGSGITPSSWQVVSPVWSRYQPDGGGFSNNHYLSSATTVRRLAGDAQSGDTVADIGEFIAKAFDSGSPTVAIDFVE